MFAQVAGHAFAVARPWGMRTGHPAVLAGWTTSAGRPLPMSRPQWDRRGRRAERIRGTLPELLRCFVHRGAGFWGMRWCPGPPVWRWSAPGSRRPGLRGAERGDTAVGGRKTPGSTRFPFRNGAGDSGWRCFPDRMGWTAPAIRSQNSRAAGRLCPDVLQFVDAEPTGSDRRLEHRRNPSLRGERTNTVIGIRLLEPGRKPGSKPSVFDTMGTVIVLSALRLRTCPGIHIRFGTE